MSRESAVRIALLLPDVLGTYSDRGNATVLAQRLRWRGMPAELARGPRRRRTTHRLRRVRPGRRRGRRAGSSPPTGCAGRRRCAAPCRPGRCWPSAPGCRCWGSGWKDSTGAACPAPVLVDLTTVPGRRRAVGEVVAEATAAGVAPLTGFENHRGRTTRGPERRAPAPGRRRRRATVTAPTACSPPTVIGTYLHGPVLARNPDLADLLLHRATGTALPPLDVPGQDAARRLHLSARRGRPHRRAARSPSKG